MLHVLKIEYPSRATHVLRGMFEARKCVFIDLLRWDLPVLAQRYEVDEFDDPHCTYLVLTDEAGAHLASARLLPTIRPHLLDHLYPHLGGGTAPRSDGIFEITRFCLDPGVKARERRQARDTLICALADHALARGIHAYRAIAERRWADQILSFGWQARRLGPPRREGANLVALEIMIDPDTPLRLREGGLVPDQSLLAPGEREAA